MWLFTPQLPFQVSICLRARAKRCTVLTYVMAIPAEIRNEQHAEEVVAACVDGTRNVCSQLRSRNHRISANCIRQIILLDLSSKGALVRCSFCQSDSVQKTSTALHTQLPPPPSFSPNKPETQNPKPSPSVPRCAPGNTKR